MFLSHSVRILPRQYGYPALLVLLMAMLMGGLIMTKPASANSYHDTDMIKVMIIKEALKSRYVSPSLALAVAETESSFRPHVVSHKGAIGVMQIMPATARGVFSVDPQRLYQPRLNIQLGIRFLDDLIMRYDGRIDLALSHYNGGSRVTKTNPPSIIPATRGYVLKVLNRARHYQTNWRGMIDYAPSTQPQMVSMPVITSPHSPHIATATHQWNGHYQWQNELKEINYWLSPKNALKRKKQTTMHMSSHISYSQKLVTRMHQNRARVGQWISENY